MFEFLDALGNRDCQASLRLLGGLLEDGQSVLGVHSMSLRLVRDLIAARALIDRGQGSLPAIARTVGRPDWQVKALPRQAQGFSAERLAEVLRAAASAEAEMKTSQDPRPRLRTVGSEGVRLGRYAVGQLHDTRLAVCSLARMDDTLTCSFVEQP